MALSLVQVVQTEGDKNDDIFDGLAVESAKPAQLRYVPGEIVGLIFPGQVTLKIGSAAPACWSRSGPLHLKPSGSPEGHPPEGHPSRPGYRAGYAVSASTRQSLPRIGPPRTGRDRPPAR
jgi:hypothetical protein